MANEDTTLREVDQELAEERQWAMFQKYGPLLIGLGFAIVIGVAGWHFWQTRTTSVAERSALEYRNALELLDENREAGQADLLAIAEEGASGFSVLAEFHRAASFAADGERAEALAVYRQLYAASSTPKRLQSRYKSGSRPTT